MSDDDTRHESHNWKIAPTVPAKVPELLVASQVTVYTTANKSALYVERLWILTLNISV